MYNIVETAPEHKRPAENLFMEIEIIERPIHFQLHGNWGAVENQRYAEVGLRLMDAMWKAVKDAHIQTLGINHWVYMADDRMFVGVEFKPNQPAATAAPLEPFEFKLRRYLKHVHVGPYHELPQKWQALKTLLASRGETLDFPSLEVYGHLCQDQDPSQATTTILIALKPTTDCSAE